MSNLIQDFKFALRTLRKSPGFTLVAVITLALGIGANTAIFSLVNAAMIRPLPYPNSGRLMSIYHAYTKLNMDHVTVSPITYSYYRDNAKSFEHIAAVGGYRAPQNLTGGGDPERVRTMKATASFFPVFGTQPALGRVFTADEDKPGAGRVAVLSYGLWNRRFGSDTGIVGRDITLDGANYTVIGVMPKGFEFPQEAELWIPMGFTPEEAQVQSEFLDVVGTLKPGVTVEQAQAEMQKMTAEVMEISKEASLGSLGWSVKTMPLRAAAVTNVKTALWILLGAVACVLLIACANVANLLLTRATARQKEIAIRAALGASRWRIATQVLAEGVLLGLLGGALGVLLGYAGLNLLLNTLPMRIPAYIRVSIDPTVLAFTFCLSIVTGLLFSAAPATQLTRGALNDVLKQGTRGSAVGGRQAVRNVITVAQVAVAMMLLVSAGLLIKSFVRVQQSDFGFEPQNVLTVRTQLPKERYKEDAQVIAFYNQVLERHRALPGVVSATVTSARPLTRNMTSSFTIQGKTFSVSPHVHVGTIGPEYFDTMHIPVRSGRTFTPADREGSAPVAMIDDKTARAYFGTENPIGHKLTFTFEGTTEKPVWREIVGVVGSVKHDDPILPEDKGQVFIPFLQHPSNEMMFALRTSGDPMAIASDARREVLNVDPLQPVQEVETMEDVLNEFVAQPRFNMVLLGLFAALALVLAAIGVYGVMAYSVTQRTQEFGIRMALGASSGSVLRTVLGQALRMALIGLAAGIAGALVATRALASLLFGVTPADPATFVTIALLLAGFALLASYLPARRATKVDPIIALRYE